MVFYSEYKVAIRFCAFLLALNGIIKAQSCLNYSTFFGKLQTDEIKGICSDKQSNIYVLGNTYNTDLPVTPGAFQSV